MRLKLEGLTVHSLQFQAIAGSLSLLIQGKDGGWSSEARREDQSKDTALCIWALERAGCSVHLQTLSLP